MKILVCISHVPDTTSKINFTENNTKFDSNGVQFIINPNDEFGLTRAMWFKEKQGASVDVINVGLQDTEPTLRKALAIGADAAIRVNSTPTDSWNVAREIAKVATENNYDLINYSTTRVVVSICFYQGFQSGSLHSGKIRILFQYSHLDLDPVGHSFFIRQQKL